MQIVSFWEEKEIRKLGILRMRVVPPECARIGHVKEELASIPEDHRYIAKFRTVNDPGFLKVRNVVQRWILEIEEESSRRFRSPLFMF